jgi:hypothetical protein
MVMYDQLEREVMAHFKVLLLLLFRYSSTTTEEDNETFRIIGLWYHTMTAIH